MAYPLIVNSEADADLQQAFLSYEQQRGGLGREFVASVNEVFERIQDNPLAFAKTHKTIRQTLVKRFPYVVCYTFDGHGIHVLAVFHGHRTPETWKLRSK